ncbi:hypothetical protein SCA6_008014 [Theobroma cacao]
MVYLLYGTAEASGMLDLTFEYYKIIKRDPNLVWKIEHKLEPRPTTDHFSGDNYFSRLWSLGLVPEGMDAYGVQQVMIMTKI